MTQADASPAAATGVAAADAAVLARARRTMIDSQLRTVGVIDDGILAAMNSVPREAHLPAALAPLAYCDAELAVAPGRYLLEPLVLALLLQNARLAAGDRVLVIGGCGGYSAAVIAAVLGGSGAVTAVESDAGLVALAAAAGVPVHAGPLTAGWAADAPYSLILFEGAIEIIPDTIAGQLAGDGRVAAVVGDGGVGHACAGPLLRGSTGNRPPGGSTGNRIAGLPFLEIAAAPLPGFARPRQFAF